MVNPFHPPDSVSEFVDSHGEDEKSSLFRFGLIGAGRMGRTHLRAFAGSELVAVTAIAEVSAPTRRTVAEAGYAAAVTRSRCCGTGRHVSTTCTSRTPRWRSGIR